MATTRDVKALAALMLGSGVLHLVRPQVFEPMVPRQLPRHRELVYLSGVAELGCAVAILRDDTRHVGGLATAALMAAIFPANVQMAAAVLRSDKAPAWFKAGVVARLPLQVPLVRTGLKAARQGR